MNTQGTTTTEAEVLVAKENGVATISLNRPAAMNALNQGLVDGLIAVLRDVAGDGAVRAVVLTGKGKAFCAGGDLFYLTSLSNVVAARQFIEQAGGITTALMAMPKPVVAMVNGVAAGAGFNLALACDIVFCASSARFAQSFAKVGLVPDCGGQYLLPRIVGPYKAKELMFTGDLIDAETASRLGIVNHVVPDDQLAAETYKFANRLVKGAPLPLAMIKKTINMSGMIDLATTLEIETESQAVCMQTADHKEGVSAFVEKREPCFSGH
jgi:2-(1,2-epoxy-1,2-dihydrophenyl)acetyl-CoA isomerase